MRKKLLKLFSTDAFFYSLLFLFVIFIFKNAFSIKFFQDDFFFLKISNAKSLSEFVNFFSPIRTYSYKPMASEVFYFLILSIGKNIFIGHLFVFIIFFIGLYYLKKTIMLLTDNEMFSKLTVFFYAISFIHVFQLYWFATFQEVLLFTSLIISFYYYQKLNLSASLIFLLIALLSKETSVLYTFFLIAFELIINRKYFYKKIQFLTANIVLSLIFYIIYQYSLKFVTSLDNYKIQFYNFKLIINNLMWYSLWSLGFPNFLSDVFRSFPLNPLPDFWKAFASVDFKSYFYSLIIYITTFIFYLIVYFKRNSDSLIKFLKISAFSIIFFIIFLGPILFFSHKWMVRLMVPQLFIIILESYFIYLLVTAKESLLKFGGILLIILYIFWNFYGVIVHETSSGYSLENRIFKNTSNYFYKNKNEILKHKRIFFYDYNKKKELIAPWGGSKKLKNSFWDQYFISYYFYDSKISALYNFETKTIPSDSYIIPVGDILFTK